MPLGDVRDAHRRIGGVDVLAAGAGGAEGVDPAVGFLDLDLDAVVDHRVDPDGGEARVPAGVGIEGRDADQAVDAGLGLEPAVGVVALDEQRRALDAASSPSAMSTRSTRNPCFAAQRAYMRWSMAVQSWLSVPPAPEWTSSSVVRIGVAGEQGLDLPPLGLAWTLRIAASPSATELLVVLRSPIRSG
jgi:hypothetical protein